MHGFIEVCERRRSQLFGKADCYNFLRCLGVTERELLRCAIANGTMGWNRTTTEFGVLKTTLKDRVSGRVIHGCVSDKAHMQKSKSAVLASTLCQYWLPQKQGGIARKTLHKKERCTVEDFKGKGWWLRFMQHWPKLALRKGDALAQPRSTVANATTISNYFDLLKKTLTTHHFTSFA